MGNDYYETNENLVHADKTVTLSAKIFILPDSHQYFTISIPDAAGRRIAS